MKLMFCEALFGACFVASSWISRLKRGAKSAMFKPVKQPSHIVGHRLKGANAKRDPLLDEQLGTSKRSRHEDGSSSVVYKETPAERQARLREEKEAERQLRAKKAKLGPSKASVLGLEEEEEIPEPDVRKVRSHQEMKLLGGKMLSIRSIQR